MNQFVFVSFSSLNLKRKFMHLSAFSQQISALSSVLLNSILAQRDSFQFESIVLLSGYLCNVPHFVFRFFFCFFIFYLFCVLLSPQVVLKEIDALTYRDKWFKQSKPSLSLYEFFERQLIQLKTSFRMPSKWPMQSILIDLRNDFIFLFQSGIFFCHCSVLQAIGYGRSEQLNWFYSRTRRIVAWCKQKMKEKGRENSNKKKS